MSLDQQPNIGSALKLDKYELTREIAGSGVATTWAAKAPDDEKNYIVLRLHKNVTKKADAADAFLRDAETGKLASHPNLIPVVHCASADGEVFVVTEQFAGEALSTLITQAKTDGLPLGVALRIGREMLEGLAAAHKATPAVAHGELNPFHILVGKDGVTRIAGFGWAPALSKFGPHGLLKPDRLAYAAPERVKALSAATANTPIPPSEVMGDVFTAGVILWELISKQRLFASKMEASVVQKVTTGPIGVLSSQTGVKIPAALNDAIHKALERESAKRATSVDEMLEAIKAIPEEEFAKPEDVAAIVEKLGAKAAAAPAVAAPVAPAAPAAPSAPKAPVGASKPPPAAPKPGALADKPSSTLNKAIPARKPTLVGGVDPTKADLPKPAARPEPLKKDAGDKPGAAAGEKSAAISVPKADGAAEKSVAISVPKADGAAEKSAGISVPKPPVIGESKRPAPPPPPPPRASAPPPPPPKIGMPKPPSFAPSKTEPPKAPAARAPAESLASDEIEVVADSSPKPLELPAPPVFVSTVGSGLEKATIPVPAMLALKDLAAQEAVEEEAKEAAKAAKAAEKSASLDIKVALESAEIPVSEAAAEAKAEVTLTAHTPTSHPSASPRDGEDSPHSRPSAKSTALDKLKPRSTLGRYEILMRVAQGGMASVWAARLQGTRGFQKTVAIKTMLPDVSDDPDFETMFLDEARVAARIRHPNVVEIFDLGEQDDVLYLVMEWVEGDTLSGIQKAAKKHGGIPQNIALRITSQISAGLHAAHELRDDNGTLVDLVHRDISPGNILISTSGFAKVTDFGVAKSAGRLHVTRAEGMVKGKTPYLSPEQLGTLPLDRRSDIFSLGVLLYVMVTGLHPFRGDTEFKTVENIALKDPLPPIQLVPSVHPDLDKLILKALDKDRTKRFSTAAELQRALDHVAAQLGDPVTDDDVAAFVRKCIGDTIAKNSADLRAAIAAADAGAAERISITSEAQLRGTTDSKPDIAPVALSDGHEKPIDVSQDSAAAAAAVAAVVSPGTAGSADVTAATFEPANDAEPKKKKNGVLYGIIGATAVAAGIGLAITFMGGSGNNPTDKPA
ncbi:MAG TPA: serine/threonine-protein kinase, partial [Polyangium sp.]|nr:serine/threonine-protein kinase [Polyangium sp.]